MRAFADTERGGRLMVELNHPAHFHLFRGACEALRAEGWAVAFVVRAKDVLLDLVRPLEADYPVFCRSTVPKRPGRWHDVRWVVESDVKTLGFARRFRPDLLLTSSFSAAHVGALLRRPCLLFTEDDAEVVPLLARLAFPFATHVVTPSCCSVGRWKARQLQYEGYHELAYLHPAHFTPDPARLGGLGGTRFFVLRFARLTAHHDAGMRGLDAGTAQRLVALLAPHGRVVISAERPLAPALEPYRLRLDPADVHHVLAAADLYIGDSQTMAAEAAVLGTPSVRFNDFVGRIGYLEELEHRYGLTRGIRPDAPERLLAEVADLVATPGLKQEWARRRARMLADKIDVAAFIVRLVSSIALERDAVRRPVRAAHQTPVGTAS